MKRIFLLVFFTVMSLYYVNISAVSEYNYRFQERYFCELANEYRYDDLSKIISDYHTNHNKIMPDVWANRLLNAIALAKNDVISDMHSEYDPFEDKNLIWFGNHKTVGPDDPYAIFDGKSFVMRFCIPVDAYIRIKEYTALVNESLRLSGLISNWSVKYIDNMRYEYFEVNLLNIKLDIEQAGVNELDSLAFRFYGRNENDHIDLFINQETTDFLNRYLRQLKSNRNLQDMFWDWMKDVNLKIDSTIIPAWAKTIIGDGSIAVYPDNIRTADYWKYMELEDSSIKSLNESSNIGKVYFFRCKINRINKKSSTSNFYWFADSLDAIGKYVTSVSIILDYAVEAKGFPAEQYEIGDEIVVAAAYAGIDTLNRKLFILGNDAEAVLIAQNALK